MRLGLICLQELIAIASGCIKTAQIAESPSASACARADYTSFQDQCYKCYVNPVCNVQTFSASVAQCNADGANLASIHSNAQNDFLYDLVTALTPQCQCSLCDSTWIGLIADPTTGFPPGFYQDGTPYDYANWDAGEPVSGNPDLRTYVSRVPGSERLWETDQALSTAQNFWCCELPTVAMACKVGYVLCAASGFCIKVVNQMPTAFSQAQANAECVADGGNLASFHSTAEYNCALVQMDELGLDTTCDTTLCDLWIGLQRIGAGPTNANFVWTDGTPVDYVNWFPGQPDDAFGGTELCVAIDPSSNQQWYDLTCIDTGGDPRGGYVCKQPPL